MGILAAITAVIPFISKLIDLFQKTDAEKLDSVKNALLSYIEEISEGVKKANETQGDTSDLEKALNRNRT